MAYKLEYSYVNMKVTQLSAALGARIEGLSPENLDEETIKQLRQAFLDHKVLFFEKQHFTTEQQIRIGELFGSLQATTESGADNRNMDTLDDFPQVLVLDSSKPERANFWHSDVTFTRIPPLGALLNMQISPAAGGDTMWANTQLAYETLSKPIREALKNLSATHGRPPATETTSHPAVTIHPETNKEILFINRGWTTKINEVSAFESKRLLELLCDHIERPEHTVRWSWSDGDAAMWDNRCTQHYAIDDYGSERRLIHRVTIYQN